jgi:hypothetical protein
MSNDDTERERERREREAGEVRGYTSYWRDTDFSCLKFPGNACLSFCSNVRWGKGKALGSEDDNISWSQIVMGTGNKLNRVFSMFGLDFDVDVGRVAFGYYFLCWEYCIRAEF